MRLDEILSLAVSGNRECHATVIVTESNGEVYTCSGRAESLLEMIDSKMLVSPVVAIGCKDWTLCIEVEVNVD